jgi:hypothetical protein
MLETLERRVAARRKRHVKYVEIVPTEDATGLVAAVYEQIARDMRVLPPAVLHSSAPELLAGAWCMLRETLLVGQVPRLIKEAVAIGVSDANDCPYWVRAHLLCLPERLAQLTGLLPDFTADDLVAIARWASRVPGKGAEAPPRVFFGLDVSEILGTAVAFQYFNRMVSVFLEFAPISLPASVSAHPGDSLALLAPAALPEDLCWAQPATVIAGAFARMARVVDSVALELIPEEVRTVVANRIARWNGEGVRLDHSWIEDTTRVLHTMDRPLAALLLLTALGSHQVDSRLVAAVRKGCPDPHDWSRYLVSVVAWAAFTAARRVGTCMEAATS